MNSALTNLYQAEPDKVRLLKILLADDDPDDCTFFKQVLNESPFATTLTIVGDGEKLMAHLLASPDNIPDILFLDLSMPRKTGFECLSEIKENDRLKNLVVVLLSTSFPTQINYEDNMIRLLMKMGAYDFIRKPDGLEPLKQAINKSLAGLAIKFPS
jgi:CheY-like chemotaxis protein